MSNPDPNPVETVCAAPAGNARADAPRSETAADWAFELIEARNVPLGGLRAMDVRRTLPQRKRSLIGAWCFLDHYGPDDVSITGGMNVAAHPHIGLQTASWLFSGAIEHRDSAGFHAFVRPGELNLMTGGSGISHSERSTRDTTVLHGAQLWIALPEHARGIPKHFEHYVPPVTTGAGWEAQVFLGSLLGTASPVTTHSPVVGAEIRLTAGSSLEIAVDAAYEHGLLVDSGEISIARTDMRDAPTGNPGSNGADGPSIAAEHRGPTPETSVPVDTLAFAPVGARSIRISAGQGADARLLLIGGAPFGEELIMWWNFIGSSHEEIAQARADWQAELARSGVAEPAPEAGGAGQPINAVALANPHRFGLPADEPEPPLPAPPLPAARLIAREQPPAPRAAPQQPQTAPGSDPVTVTQDAAGHRFVISVEGALAGFTRYREAHGGTAYAFVHTEIDPEFGGRGLGGRLVSAALARTRDLGRTIVPYCPFVAGWLRKHPEFDGDVRWPNGNP